MHAEEDTVLDTRYKSAMIVASVFLLLVTNSQSHASALGGAEASGSSVRIQVVAGFNTFGLGDAKDAYESSLQSLRYNGVPIPTQRNFANNILVGLDGLYRLTPTTETGLGIRYTESPAKSIYEDYSGHLELSGNVRMLTLEAIIQTEVANFGSFRSYVGARGGGLYGQVKFASELTSDEYPEIADTEDIEKEDYGFTVEGYAGMQRPMGKVTLGGQVGYRYALATSAIGGMDLNLEGITALLTVSISL